MGTKRPRKTRRHQPKRPPEHSDSSDSTSDNSSSHSDSDDSEYTERKTDRNRSRTGSNWTGRLRRTLLSSLLERSTEVRRAHTQCREVEPPFVPNNLDELVALAQRQQQEGVHYTDCARLTVLLPHLLELRALVGLQDIKTSVSKLVLRHLQVGLPRPPLNHAVVYGNPGVGKTTFVNVLAKIMSCLGVTESSKVIHGSQESMVAGYLGQTAEKTQALVESALGGVLLLDEASSLSDGRSSHNTDSFSKSAVDTLNRLLTERADEFVCILAGYEDEIQRDFFSINPGLARRFPTVYRMGAYTADELAEITVLKLQQSGVVLVEPHSVRAELFRGESASHFTAMGGDVATLVSKILNAHAQRVFGKNPKTAVEAQSVREGFAEYLRTKKELQKPAGGYPGMYI